MSESKGAIKILDKSLRGGFTQVPNTILKNSEISYKARFVYTLLLTYAWDHKSCYPGHEQLSEDMGVSRFTIIRALNELKDYKLIKWKRNGAKKNNVYYILSIGFLSRQNKKKRCGQNVDKSVSCCTSAHHDVAPAHITPIYNTHTNNTHFHLNNKTNENGKNIFDLETEELVKELNSPQSRFYFQELVSKANVDTLLHLDMEQALQTTRERIQALHIDGLHPLKNPGGYFVSLLKKLQVKRNQQKNIETLDKLRKSMSVKRTGTKRLNPT